MLPDNLLRYEATQSGVIFVEVIGRGYDDVTPYTLTASQVGEPQSGEIPGSPYSTAGLDIGESAVGVIDAAYDQDWYGVRLEAGAAISSRGRGRGATGLSILTCASFTLWAGRRSRWTMTQVPGVTRCCVSPLNLRGSTSSRRAVGKPKSAAIG